MTHLYEAMLPMIAPKICQCERQARRFSHLRYKSRVLYCFVFVFCCAEKELSNRFRAINIIALRKATTLASGVQPDDQSSLTKNGKNGARDGGSWRWGWNHWARYVPNPAMNWSSQSVEGKPPVRWRLFGANVVFLKMWFWRSTKRSRLQCVKFGIGVSVKKINPGKVEG